MIRTLTLFLNLFLLVKSNLPSEIELVDEPTDKSTYLFLYAGLSPMTISKVLDISLAEILLSKYTIAVEARGWAIRYAGAELTGYFSISMW